MTHFQGGTVIGTARCLAFRSREGRLKAAANLVKHGIDALIVIGGDGSLTGADVLRSEWQDLLTELVEKAQLTEEEAAPYKHLTIVGLVGSIDNDMSSTDMTIGAATCLHRICESVDSISTTASSHSRAFVIEVMGRHCGWLALMAGVSTGADFVFTPERPPPHNWEEAMCKDLQTHRELGKRKTIVIIAEGAIDQDLKPIESSRVKQVLEDKLGLDTRVTILGHTQRGGTPCAYDRILATIQGAKAVEAVLNSTPETPSPMIGISENKITNRDLMTAVALTKEVANAISQKNFRHAMELRDPEFAEQWEAFEATSKMEGFEVPKEKRLKVAIIHVGAPAAGMNAATRAAVRYCLNRGHTPLAIHNGFAGLLKDNVTEMNWSSVDNWVAKGGSELGTNRTQPTEDIGLVAYQFQKHQFDGLMIVGGFEAFTAIVSLKNARQTYASFAIPMAHLPATISNNVPGTDFSLGSDTCLNTVMESCDAIKQSATASRNRVFVVETQGGRCGYVAVMSGLAVGATVVYIPEEGISLHMLSKDVDHLIHKYKQDMEGKNEGRLVLRNEKANATYSTEIVSAIFREEGREYFDSRTSVLGHIQQGRIPSPLDRIRANRQAVRCIRFIEDHAPTNKQGKSFVKSDESAAVICIRGARCHFVPIDRLLEETDMKNRRGKKNWWYEYRPLIDILAGRVIEKQGP